MVKQFTQNDVVSFLYNEVEKKDAVTMGDLIASDDTFRKSYTTIRDTKNALPKVNLIPSQSTISRVLLYSSLNKVEKCN